MEAVRLGIVGCGKMGQGVHLWNFLQTPHCRITAICDKDGDLARQVAEKYHVHNWYASAAEMLAGIELDAVAAIMLWPLNEAVSMEVIQAGKHLYIEKPMASNSQQAERMADVAAKKGTKLMVAYMKRYDPGVRSAKSLVDAHLQSGEMGKITHAQVYNFMGDWTHGYDMPLITSDRPPERPAPVEGCPDFVRKEDQSSYMCSMSNFCHDVNLMRYLLGQPERVAFCNWRRGTGPHCSRITAVFDYGEFDCVFETGSLPTSTFNEGVRIYFEKGWLEAELPAPLWVNTPARVTLCKEGKVEVLPYEWGWSFAEETKHFIDCVVNDKEPLSSGDDSVKDILLTEAMYRAHVDQGTVKG